MRAATTSGALGISGELPVANLKPSLVRVLLDEWSRGLERERNIKQNGDLSQIKCLFPQAIEI